MQVKCNTKSEINKVSIGFTSKKITAYGGFSLLAAFFEKIKLKEILEGVIPVKEESPNRIGIYSKILAYILVITTVRLKKKSLYWFFITVPVAIFHGLS